MPNSGNSPQGGQDIQPTIFEEWKSKMLLPVEPLLRNSWWMAVGRNHRRKKPGI